MLRSLLLTAAALAACFHSPLTLAIGRLADVSVVDRDSGRVLHVHPHGGEFWVEGRPGARYAIRVRNSQGSRVLAVTSVDGINVVTGETAAIDQRGYVFEPWSSYDIAGWRKSEERIAAFEFTSVPRSYAAKTGRPEHVGVIGVALFREKAPIALEAPAPSASRGWRESQQALGTGHGRIESSVVTQVAFERAQPAPDEVIRVCYDSRASLVAMGIIRAGQPAPPEPFPASTRRYVPDP